MKQLPWNFDDKQSLALIQAINGVARYVKNTVDKKAAQKNFPLSPKEASKLEQSFKNAEMARGRAQMFMTALAEAMKVSIPETAVKVAPMKGWTRASEKFNAAGRNLHDLGRGRIWVRSADEIENFYKTLQRKTKTGLIRGFKLSNVRILEDCTDDYLKDPRSSGFAGAINLDIEINHGRNRSGKFESANEINGANFARNICGNTDDDGRFTLICCNKNHNARTELAFKFIRERLQVFSRKTAQNFTDEFHAANIFNIIAR